MAREIDDIRRGYIALFAIYGVGWLILFVVSLLKLPSWNVTDLIMAIFGAAVGSILLGTPVLLLLWISVRIAAKGFKFLHRGVNRALQIAPIVIGAVLLVAIAGKVLIFTNPTSTIGYRLEYQTNSVLISPRPYDCDFLTAPIGSKRCHYESSVDIVVPPGELTERSVRVSWLRRED